MAMATASVAPASTQSVGRQPMAEITQEDIARWEQVSR